MGSDAMDVSQASVLVLDSNAFTRGITLGFLRAAGVGRLADASNLEDAVGRYREIDPHALLVEWEDKGLDGLEITRSIRGGATPFDRAIPIVVTTSRASISDVEAARRIGVTEYAVKPMSARAIVSRIEQVLYRPRPFIVTDSYVGPCRRRSIDPYFMGPFRRAADPKLDPNADPIEQMMKVRLSSHVSRLAFEAKTYMAGERWRVRFVLSACTALRDVALEIGDEPAGVAAESLHHYLSVLGSDSRVDPTVVEMHIAALGQLVGLPNAETALRDQVATGLQKVVAKRLSPAQRTRAMAR
ncbi:MAG: response regulator [Alphaproteobacteria bacterium]|nr:response regulator [Alphaproteobacteria bacterium]